MSYTLKILFGASVSGDWLVIGFLCNMVVVGTILMVNELFTAVENAVLLPWQQHGSQPKTGIVRRRTHAPLPPAANAAPVSKPTRGQYYRIALGLAGRPHVANRRWKK